MLPDSLAASLGIGLILPLIVNHAAGSNCTKIPLLCKGLGFLKAIGSALINLGLIWGCLASHSLI